MEDFIYNHKKRLKWGGIVVVIVIVALIVCQFVWLQIFSAKINIIVAPNEIAKVKIADKEYEPRGTYRFQPGEYEAEIYADGFSKKTVKVTAVKGETVNLAEFLEPLAENKNWYNEHSEDAVIMGEVINNETVIILEKLGAENPILKQLPYTVDYFTKDYSGRIYYTVSYRLNNSDTGFELIIKDYGGGNEENAKQWIAGQSVDINKVKVVYEDLSSDGLNYRAG